MRRTRRANGGFAAFWRWCWRGRSGTPGTRGLWAGRPPRGKAGAREDGPTGKPREDVAEGGGPPLRRCRVRPRSGEGGGERANLRALREVRYGGRVNWVGAVRKRAAKCAGGLVADRWRWGGGQRGGSSEARNWSRSEVTSAGRSCWVQWPQPSRRANTRRSGTTSRRRWMAGGLRAGSRVPVMKSAG